MKTLCGYGTMTATSLFAVRILPFGQPVLLYPFGHSRIVHFALPCEQCSCRALEKKISALPLLSFPAEAANDSNQFVCCPHSAQRAACTAVSLRSQQDRTLRIVRGAANDSKRILRKHSAFRRQKASAKNNKCLRQKKLLYGRKKGGVPLCPKKGHRRRIC